MRFEPKSFNLSHDKTMDSSLALVWAVEYRVSMKQEFVNVEAIDNV